MIQDMTAGSPLRLLVVFSVPLLLGGIFQQFYNMADTIIVGRTLGVDALAAVGSTGPIMFLVFGFFFGLTGGVSVITAQRFGAHDPRGVRRSVAASCWICGTVTLLATAGCLLSARPLLRLMNTPENIFEDAVAYLGVIYLGTAALVFYNLISSLLRALGDSRTPLFFLIVSSLLNIGLDLLFILTFGWGVAGAAWATVVSQAAAGLWCLVYARRKYRYFRLSRRDWRMNWPFLWEHLRVATPMALQFSITAIGVIVLQAALNRFGSTAIAAFTTGCKIDQLTVQPIFSFGMALATFAAQNFGAGKWDRVRAGVRQCTLLMVPIGLIGGILMVIFCRPLTELFVGAGHLEVESKVRTFLLVNAIFYPVLALLFVYRNVLQGIGRTFVPMMAGVSELVIRSLGAISFAAWWGYLGVCFSGPAAWIGAMLPMAVAYFRILRENRRKIPLTPPHAVHRPDPERPR